MEKVSEFSPKPTINTLGAGSASTNGVESTDHITASQFNIRTIPIPIEISTRVMVSDSVN
jgi:hypothetical protein